MKIKVSIEQIVKFNSIHDYFESIGLSNYIIIGEENEPDSLYIIYTLKDLEGKE